MRVRADAAEETRRRILAAAVDLLAARLRSDVHLDEVARRAGVSVQTVLRAYGSRSALLDRALEGALREIAEELDRAGPGDIEGSVSAWFDHYERVGDLVVRNLADESDPAAAGIVTIGRARHRRRVERQFGPQLARVPDAERQQVVDGLVCVCDVYAWKLLRRDMGRSRRQAEATMTRMARALLGGD